MITKTQLYLLSKVPEKLRRNITVNDNGCWLWSKNINGQGYGRVSIASNGNNKRVAAHIYMYKMLKGEYLKGLVLDHIECSNRNCCNPTHVSPVTQKQNIHRGKLMLFKKLSKPLVEPDFLADLLLECAYIVRV